jgi:hypothetical protein
MGFLKRGLLFFPGSVMRGNRRGRSGYPRKAFSVLNEKTFLIGKQDVKRILTAN